MNLPPHIHLQVTSASAITLEDIIVQMTVTAGAKNPFHILIPKTASDGSSSISAKDFTSQFSDHYVTGLMDYDGSIASASPVVSITLFDPSVLVASLDLVKAWPLLPHERTKWRSREEVIKYLLSSRNPKFDAQPETVVIAEGTTIYYNVTPRAA